MSSSPKSVDHWLPWLLALPFLYPAFLLLAPLLHIDGFFLLMMVGLLLFGIGITLVIFVIVTPVVAIRPGFRKKIISAIIAPIIFAISVCLTRTLIITGEVIQFYAIRQELQARVDSVHGDIRDKFLVFEQGGLISTMTHGFAFDGSDGLAQPPGDQSKSWELKAKGTELECNDWTAIHITGHYYRWFSWC